MAVGDVDGCDDRTPEEEVSEGLQVYGAVLQAFRQDAGYTQESFAPKIRYSVHYIAKIEQGRRFPPRDLPERVEPVLGPTAAGALKAAAKKLNRKAGLASWFQHWAEVEEQALTLNAYECRVVPGLLQPEAYMREVMNCYLPPLTDEQLELQVAARLARQRLLTERGTTMFSFVMEQHLVERELGGPEVTRNLISHLLSCARLRNVELLVMPRRRTAHAGLEGSLYLAEGPDHEWVGYVEGHQASLLYNDPNQVSTLLQRYGRMRGQALDPEASIRLLEQLRGAP
ncbi:transcriptional regulator [Streptomyces sp. CC53]|nr:MULTISPECIES: helix-turn-helix transcriptional regulator [unclassified Streptomyces]OII64743.1 transcriptional regulator [Streptomyces sp. CC53]OII69071.1 transcriptional regulator [Streptomyces sp. CC77]